MDTRGRLLHDLDQAASEVTGRRGHAQADQELAALFGLAEAIAGGVGEWRDLTQGCERLTAWDLRRAGALILESVFDELLPPPQWRFLAAALALSWGAE
ncbi:MAG TPA: hypothetical protein VGI30_01045 [Caulobacteraceae bacterium]|jgi:hypothetical protein